MSTLDLIIIASYVLVLFIVGISVGLKEKLDDFLVVGRKVKLPLVLFSVVSSWVGVGAMVGTASSGYDTGISYGLNTVLGAIVAVIGAGMFAPTIKRFGDKHKAHTIGDFFAIRYSKANQILVGFIIMLVYILFTAVQFVGLSYLLQTWTGTNLEILIGLTAISTIIYTAFAGIKSDFYTDTIHFWVMVIVLFAVMLPAVWAQTNGIAVFSQLPPSYFDPFAFGGISFFIAGLILGFCIVFVSMEIWQRIYASTSAQTAKWALIGSAAIIAAFYILSTYLGMVAKIVDPNLANRDLALFTLMKQFLPNGFLGLGVAAFIATFVSTINTMMMVVSATMTKDFYKGFIKPKATDHQLLIFGRLSTIFTGVLGFGIAIFIQDILAIAVPAFFLLLVLLPATMGGFFWKKATATASFWSILIGFLVSIFLIPIMPKTAFLPGFIISLIVFIGVSYNTNHAKSENFKLASD